MHSAVSQHLVVIFLVAGVLSAWPSSLAAETWYEHYAEAEEALAKEEWRTAIEEVTKALEKRGDSGARVRTYGMKFTPYFPYLKLGIAYYQLGQLDAALQAFETEEQLGSILSAEEAQQELSTYRALTLAAQAKARQDETARIQGIVDESLREARQLESEKRLEEAIASLGRALAVAPDDGDATAMMTRLRAALAKRQEESDRAERIDGLVQRGRQHLLAGELSEASSVLRQALSLADSDDVRALLEQAQQRLRQELETEQEEERADVATEALEETLALQEAGRVSEALDRLQSVLALDPLNRQALVLQESLLADQASAEKENQRRDRIAELLVTAEASLTAGNVGESMAAANRVLALDASNQSALENLARAYRMLNRQLLADGLPRQNVPPAISFLEAREELDDGTLAQRVREPHFMLSGVVIDDSPVSVEFFDTSGAAVEGVQHSRELGELFITDFQAAVTLSAGLRTLRLVASDEEGLTSSSEYMVLYERPFVRTPWFAGILAGTLVVCTGAILSQRSRRRRRLRERRFNPYTAGSPVLDEKLFFGRQQLLDRILQTLHNNSMLLHGERRIGKTTLQHQLKNRLLLLEDPAYEFHPVFVDLQGTPEERFFATLAEEIFDELTPSLEGLEPSTPLAGEYAYRDFVKDLREILRRLRKRSEKEVRLVLLIDEVDELNSYDPRINQKLRSLFMKSFAENLVAVVSGVSIKREWNREGSPWYNFFEEIDVGPFHPQDARQLVEQPVRGVIKLDEGVVERILEITECRPYRIQKLCMELVNRTYEQGGRRISVTDVDAVGMAAGAESS